MISKGYVGVFAEPFTQERVRQLAETWLSSNYKVEQVCPGPRAGNTALTISKPEDILWETHLQFRVLNDLTFSWAYLSLERRVIETSGMPDEGNTLPLDILLDLPGLTEVVELTNDHRLDQLEAEGLM